tara:strand:+ start:1193 stop:1612 length:420 start_codon:yes stop_codon:yes gene_type:complete
MDIRPITKSDYTGYTKLADTGISRDEFNEFLDNVLNTNHRLYVGITSGIVIGTGTLLIERKMTYGGCRMGHIENIIVSEACRNAGVGQSIVEKLIEVTRSNGCYRIDLNCNSELEHFYNKCGFGKKTICMNLYIKDNFN